MHQNASTEFSIFLVKLKYLFFSHKLVIFPYKNDQNVHQNASNVAIFENFPREHALECVPLIS